MRRYTRHELEAMDITTLKAVCKELKIKSESMNVYQDKSAMVQMIFKYRGTISERYINEWNDEKINRLKKAIDDKGEKLTGQRFEIPAYFNIYMGLESLNERGREHKIYTETDIDLTSALLINQKGDILAVVNVIKSSVKNTYYLQLREHMLNKNITPGIYKNFSIVFFPGDFDKILRIYNLADENITRFTYALLPIQEVIIRSIEETDDVLIIDYGTSYTTAGTYVDYKIRHIWFHSDEPCGCDPSTPSRYADCRECGRCALCPSVIAVKHCNENEVEFSYGNEARNRLPMARNSIFFDTKRWVNNYTEMIDVKDLNGATKSVRRSQIIEGFINYIINTAQQQNKVRYKNICFTSPVRQKAMSVSMYKNLLEGYNVEERDAIDEALAVVYDSISSQVEDLDYEDGYEKSVLLIDCGGSTSDMVKCDYVICHQKKRSNIDMKIGYANGDTNFGGNNLTYRIMQYIKIKLARFYAKESPVGIDGLLDISYSDVFDFIDKYGIKKTYEIFEEAYRRAGNIIPTNFSDYTNDAETIYYNVRGNFYFLWNLAEQIKIDLYSSSGSYEYSFNCFKESKSIYMLAVKNEKGSFVTYTENPPIRILRDEINLLLKPEIYNLLKRFIEPYYIEDETMNSITNIMLSGQTTKIELFRDVLKEYIAGHKARAPYEHGYSKKLKCIRGAVTYYGAKAIGRIRPNIKYESAVVPYYLTAEMFNEEKEKLLINKGELLSSVYSYIDRTYETKIMVFKLRDQDKEILQTLKFNLSPRDFKKTDYHELLKNYPALKQGDIDRIDEWDVRLFIYSDDESWGFKWIGVTNMEGDLFCGEERFVPFESTEWETNFFDGRR